MESLSTHTVRHHMADGGRLGIPSDLLSCVTLSLFVSFLRPVKRNFSFTPDNAAYYRETPPQLTTGLLFNQFSIPLNTNFISLSLYSHHSTRRWTFLTRTVQCLPIQQHLIRAKLILSFVKRSQSEVSVQFIPIN